jgi:hypothetical protein
VWTTGLGQTEWEAGMSHQIPVLVQSTPERKKMFFCLYKWDSLFATCIEAFIETGDKKIRGKIKFW